VASAVNTPIVTPAPASSNAGVAASTLERSPRKPSAPKTQEQGKLLADVSATAPVKSRALATKPIATQKPVGGSRLKLEPLDLSFDRDPVLRLSDELLIVPQELATPERAQAAAIWRALNLSPEDALRDAQRLESLQTDIAAIQTVTSNNQKSLLELREKLQRAQSEKYANGLVYSLIALCMFAFAAVVFLWQRLRQVQAPSWTQGIDASDSMLVYADQGHDPQPTAPEPEKQVTPPFNPSVTSPTASAVDLDINLMEAPSSAPRPQRDSASSAFANSRSMNSQELVDIRQQAEFFITLDQHDKAIELLSTRVAQCGETSPLICLELLSLYHSLGRREDFDILRTEFNHWFTGYVPEFPSFLDEGQALNNYPGVLSRITELWPAPSVLDYIECTIYQHSNVQTDARFDLQAYRELLLLHSIAKRITRLAYGNEDEHPSEFMRIPASASALDADDTQAPADSRAIAHRAGAHLRGTWNTSDQAQGTDVALHTEATPSVLGAMRVPVHVAPPLDIELELEPQEPKKPITDFNFRNL
jgi:hypothetical protein